MASRIPVFIVEDSSNMRSALQQLVEEIGAFRVVATAAGESEATAWLQDLAPEWQVAITDLILADGSGYGVIRRFKSARPDGKVIVFSEYATPAVKERCLQLGADAAFLKSELKSFVRFLEEAAES